MSSNESIVGPDDSGRLTPKKSGTCTLTAQVKHPVTGAVRLSASLTVKVGSFVTGIDILHYNLACYVGDDLTATAYSTGRASISVLLESPDLLEESVASIGTSVSPKRVTKSFDVVMTSAGPTSIELPDEITVPFGQTLDLTTQVTLTPADAALDYSLLRWSSPMSSAGQYYKIENNVLTPLQPTMNGFP